MELIKHFIDIVLHLDAHLVDLVSRYGTFSYAILFAIIFCETGLVVTPFLPAIRCSSPSARCRPKARSILHRRLIVDAGRDPRDSTNYWIGYFLGPKVFRSESSRWFQPLVPGTHQRFLREIRRQDRDHRALHAHHPHLCALHRRHRRMSYPRFLCFSVIGSFLWIGLFIAAGYIFGAIPFVKRNFTLVVLAVIFISILPALIEVARARMASKQPVMSEI